MVARTIKDYVAKGGFLFAMCSATDSYDIALAAEGVDICESMYDGDRMDPGAQGKLDYSKCLAFHNFVLETNPLVYEYSNLDTSNYSVARGPEADFFTLFEEYAVDCDLRIDSNAVVIHQVTFFDRALVFITESNLFEISDCVRGRRGSQPDLYAVKMI